MSKRGIAVCARLLTAGAMAVAISATVSGQAVVARTYHISSVRFDMPSGSSVGPKRSGALCLPAGSISWRDARPDAGDAVQAIEQAFRQAGVTVSPAGGADAEPSPADVVIQVNVRALRLSACVPPGGMGRLLNRSRTIKGDGVIATTWRVFERGDRTPPVTISLCRSYPFRSVGGVMADMTLAGLAQAATSVARHLLQSAPVSARAVSDTCSSAGIEPPGLASSYD